MNEKIFTHAIHKYNTTNSIKAVASDLGVTESKARKILVTANVVIDSETLSVINKLTVQGLTPSEIAKKIGITKNYINSYLPYEKGIYNSDHPSENSLRIKKHRLK